MRIALLASSGQLGGAERVVLASAEALRTLGHLPIVVAPEHGTLVDACRAAGIEATDLQMPAGLAGLGESSQSAGEVLGGIVRAAGALTAYRRRLGLAIEAAGAEAIHAHGIKANLLSASLPRRCPVIWHLHDYVGLRSTSRRLLSAMSGRSDLAIAVSDDVARDARRWLPRTPIVVVHNAVDTDRFTPDGPVADLDASAGLAAPTGQVTRIGLPATFATWKGHTIFLDAIARLGRRDVRGYVIGGPVYRTGNQWTPEELSRQIATRGLLDRVGLTGLVGDMPAAYRALDIVVHASTRPEPFGLVIPEAMACGRLVVAVRTGGAGELFEPEVNAVGLQAADAAVLATMLEALVDDPRRRARLAGRARAHVVERFGRDRFRASLAAALTPVVGGRAAAAGHR